MMDLIGFLIVASGALALLLAAYGVLILPDALSRQHAATKAATLALMLICAGSMLILLKWTWIIKLSLITIFLMLTLPVSAQMLAGAANTEQKHNK